MTYERQCSCHRGGSLSPTFNCFRCNVAVMWLSRSHNRPTGQPGFTLIRQQLSSLFCSHETCFEAASAVCRQLRWKLPPSPFPPNSGGSNTSNSTFAAERADGRTRHETSERSLAIQISFRSVFPRLRHAFFTKQNVPTATMYAQAQTLHNNVACAPPCVYALSSLSVVALHSPLTGCYLSATNRMQ